MSQQYSLDESLDELLKVIANLELALAAITQESSDFIIQLLTACCDCPTRALTDGDQLVNKATQLDVCFEEINISLVNARAQAQAIQSASQQTSSNVSAIRQAAMCQPSDKQHCANQQTISNVFANFSRFFKSFGR